MTRYVIAVYPETEGSHPYTPSVDVLGLPDAEHVHVTIKDGTVTAVPMVQVHGRMSNMSAWVDAPGNPT